MLYPGEAQPERSGAPFHFLLGGQHVASEMPLLRVSDSVGVSNGARPTAE